VRKVSYECLIWI